MTATLDSTDIVALTRSLVDIDSTTGREGAAARWLADYLRGHGWSVLEQRVDATRFNVIAPPAGGAAGAVTFSTHIDCVPPFFPSRLDGDRLSGRGACDAKGILAAQVVAADRLRRAGETRIGLAFVVGEERGSDGARAANDAAVGDAGRYLINGEPTDNRLGLATRGILRLKLRASGRAAHSSFPELGESAIDKLIDALVELRSIALPDDPVLGRTHYTLGLIEGGIAPNVVSPSAEAEVMFRTVSDAAEVRRAVAPLEQRVTIEHVLEVPPVRLTTVPGFDAAVFPYTTDIPFLSRWGAPLLFGPGSIHVAHTADEYVSVAELHAAADHYVTLARTLLG
ncbi:MAG TPA: M20/M25/M40 family metallo-hydrolase [Vicinamibacterales bacterium]|nr:M20/M25/M40 family metallo-hydrolase [Vicinamibacterales bacterium]